tara:strand:- start:13129 stop:13788 length:660 start_codon:yes stop_codon:yes gene_type:complete
MPNIICSSYFENGNQYIPNNKDINTEPTSSPTSITEIDYFIEEYERELLLNSLGVILYNELQLSLEDLDSAEQRWKDLVEGKEYTNSNGDVRLWEGLRGVNKQSVISLFVYTEYLRNHNETYSTVGVVKNIPKNAEIYNPTPKFIKAHRKFIKYYQGNINNNFNGLVVNGFGSFGVDYFNKEVNVSLYRFLNDSNELNEIEPYPNFSFKFYEELNSFGI